MIVAVLGTRSAKCFIHFEKDRQLTSMGQSMPFPPHLPTGRNSQATLMISVLARSIRVGVLRRTLRIEIGRILGVCVHEQRYNQVGPVEEDPSVVVG